MCCLSRNGNNMSIPPSCTIHHTSMLPSENCSTLLGKKEMFLATSRARWAAVVTRTVPRDKKERTGINREESFGLPCFPSCQENKENVLLDFFEQDVLLYTSLSKKKNHRKIWTVNRIQLNTRISFTRYILVTTF